MLNSDKANAQIETGDILRSQEITTYIADLYSKLIVMWRQKSGPQTKFKIGRGIFQGDTLSPHIFLIAFNPIIQLA